MREYETIVILKPDVAEIALKSLTKKIEKVITAKPGKILEKDDWGIKRLAYPIRREMKGRYLYWSFAQLPTVLRELDRTIRFDENVLRQLTVVTDRDPNKAKPKPIKKSTEAQAESAESAAGGRRKGGRVSLEPDTVFDYKNASFLANFLTDRSKIAPRRMAGANAYQQRRLTQAIKRARQIALLPYTGSLPAEVSP